MAYTAAEAWQDLLEAIARAIDELRFASACLAEAYEQLDEHNGDRLEEVAFRPVQTAYGRARRTYSGFAGRHGLETPAFAEQPPGLPSQGAAGFIERAIEAVGAADTALSELQDSMLPVEAGDEELRAGLKSVRESLDGVPLRARELLRGLGR
jgi:hypothetical protein